jgi:hypothetical protein
LWILKNRDGRKERREGRISTTKLSTQPNIEKEGNLRFSMRL